MKWAPAIGSKAAIPQSNVPPFTGFQDSKAAGWCINRTCNDWSSHGGNLPQWVVMGVRFFFCFALFLQDSKSSLG